MQSITRLDHPTIVSLRLMLLLWVRNTRHDWIYLASYTFYWIYCLLVDSAYIHQLLPVFIVVVVVVVLLRDKNQINFSEGMFYIKMRSYRIRIISLLHAHWIYNESISISFAQLTEWVSSHIVHASPRRNYAESHSKTLFTVVRACWAGKWINIKNQVNEKETINWILSACAATVSCAPFNLLIGSLHVSHKYQVRPNFPISVQTECLFEFKFCFFFIYFQTVSFRISK